MANRLDQSTSPYLRQHAENPVDWMPWGEEAFARAASEGKPVFLSVGYSSCHWCHVMAHDSFEDAETAARMNASYVCVKVDREERPDVDEAYMAFVQMATGRGGWPMSVFLTPDRKPFYGGTYWPRARFGEILAHLSGLWAERRAEVQGEADRIGGELARYFGAPSPGSEGALTPELYTAAVVAGTEVFDATWGGFGSAPKFPPHTALEMLMGYALSDGAEEEAREAALAMAFVTLERMCRGGIRDHVGGGFHRYSTDREWLVPHFEKMLYDNALMLGNLVRAGAIAREIDPARADLFQRAAEGIVGWLDREMTSPEGLFYSALDADSPDEHGHSEEGAYYAWRYDELPSDVAEAYGARPGGNFRDEATGAPTGKNILHLIEGGGGELDDLLARRSARPRPGLDDKAIVGWNGLTIGALAEAGRGERAARAARVLLAFGNSLPHTIVGGEPQGEGFLEDYAALADGLFKLADLVDAEGGGEGADWRAEATRLGRRMIDLFEERATGAFLSTSETHESLFGRTRSTFDAPVPSGNALALRVLVAMGDEGRARRLVAALLGTMERAPTATEGLYAAASPLVSGVLPPGGGAETTALLEAAEVRTDAQGRALLTVVLDLAEGVHVNGPNPPARWLTPTRVTVAPLASEVAYPAATDDRYTGRVEIPIAVRLAEEETGADLEITLTYQPCTDSECLLPVVRKFDAVVSR